MTIIQSLILGIIQGLTEFLPISSSAHLVLVPYLLGWNIPQSEVFPFDVLVQLGTLAAVIIYFWADLWTILKEFFRAIAHRKPFETFEARMGWYLIIATIPAGFAGLLLKSKVEAAFGSATMTAIFLIVTAAMLIVAETVGKRTRNIGQLNWLDAIWIGVFQAVSIFPGISRSGSTITGGMTRNLDRSSAARFSFLMSVPVMLAAGLVSVKDLLKVPNLSLFLPVMAIGFITAGIVGYLSIHWLLGFVKNHSLVYFALYCMLVGAAVLGVSAYRASSAAGTAAVTQSPTPFTLTAATAPADTASEAAPLPGSVTSAGAGQKNAVVINLEYTSGVAWMEPAFSACADALNTTGLVTNELPASQLDLSRADVLIRLGAPDPLVQPAAQLGMERVALAVNFNNPLKALTADLARRVLSGEITSWSALAAACPECFAGSLADAVKDEPIELNFYSSDDDLQQAFEQAVMGNLVPARSQALLIPDSAAMVDSLAYKVNAVGILPAHMIKGDVKEVGLSDVDPATLEQPILAITNSQPDGALQTWLGCLQQVLTP